MSFLEELGRHGFALGVPMAVEDVTDRTIFFDQVDCGAVGCELNHRLHELGQRRILVVSLNAAHALSSARLRWMEIRGPGGCVGEYVIGDHRGQLPPGKAPLPG